MQNTRQVYLIDYYLVVHVNSMGLILIKNPFLTNFIRFIHFALIIIVIQFPLTMIPFIIIVEFVFFFLFLELY
jgi:hypothetical protein